MNVIDALNSRFTVRAFKPNPAHNGTILKILDAATLLISYLTSFVRNWKFRKTCRY
jgi:nitroreductase